MVPHELIVGILRYEQYYSQINLKIIFIRRISDMSVEDTIKQQVTAHPVVLYMKGTLQQPQCGFSANAVNILSSCGVEDFLAVDVLADPEIRQGIKEYSNWPTIPQLYVKGEFVGGSDIISEMYGEGELQKLFQK